MLSFSRAITKVIPQNHQQSLPYFGNQQITVQLVKQRLPTGGKEAEKVLFNGQVNLDDYWLTKDSQYEWSKNNAEQNRKNYNAPNPISSFIIGGPFSS